MTTLEKIRAEIKTKYDSIPWRDNDYNDGWVEALEWVYDDVIGKYAEQEPCDDVVSRQAVLDGIEELKQSPWFNDDTHEAKIIRKEAVEIVEDLCVKQLPSVRPQEQTGKCRTCKYGEIYNDLWCKCHDPLLNGVMVKMTDQCRAEEIIDLNRKYKAERSDKE